MKDPSAERQANGRIRIATARLAGKYLFHAKILQRLILEPRWDIDTMGVMAEKNTVLLAFNPDFVRSLPLPELTGLLLHQVHHVLLGHTTSDPAAYPDRWALLVAQEVTVNEFVHEPMPAGGIYLDQFPGLPPMESTMKRYDQLSQLLERMPILGPSGELLADGSGHDDAMTIADEHGLWADAAGDVYENEAMVKALVQDAAIEAGRDAIPHGLAKDLRRLGIGVDPGEMEKAIAATARARLPWARLLRRYTGQVAQRRSDMRQPPRRMPHMVGVMPGRRRRTGHPRITAVIDTSGSITEELLELISAELGDLARQFGVTVIECDVKIQRIYPFKPINSVRGRGGTDLRPAFEPEIIRRLRPDLIIYFTDGYGPAPASAPRVPVVWCLTPRSKVPAAWGRVIRMENETASEI